MDKVIPVLEPEDYEKDEKQKTVTLTESGQEKMEELLRSHGLLHAGGLYDIHNVSLVHHVNQALRAHKLFARDTEYIVKDDKIIIIDEFTGRMMEGRRYSEGLHQALEAKEGVTVQNENQTLASITFQNYFRMYPKLAGMTGTAMTEAEEFSDIYRLEVIEVPTNLPVARADTDDEVYRSTREKFDAVVKQIIECSERKQPVLCGTVSIEKSEALSALLKKHKVEHNVLNARYHEQEAYIIAQAGRPGAVTIATNMAGRGTDIQLGGNLDMRLKAELALVADPEERERRAAAIRAEIEAARDIVREAGGLFVIGSERHESRRIDNQLRGRSGRQGDPGASKFFVSLEDDLMRIFGSERMESMLSRLGLKEGEAIIHPWVNKALAKAQQKVEARNYDIRKQLLKYDDVMNDQRKVVYDQRREIMNAEDVAATIADMRTETVAEIVARSIPENALSEQWDIAGLHAECLRLLALDVPLADWAKEEGIDRRTVEERLVEAAERHMQGKEATFGEELMRMAEKSLLLQFLDHIWKDHLLQLDHLRQGINLRAYAQRDPLNEYKREAFELFEAMLVNLREQVTGALSHLEMRMDAPPEPAPLPFGELSYTEEFPLEPEAVFAEADPLPQRLAGGGEEARSPAGERPGRAAAGADLRERAARGGAARAMGRNGPQRTLPVRIGPQVQTLPRPHLRSAPRHRKAGRRVGGPESGRRAGISRECRVKLGRESDLRLGQRRACPFDELRRRARPGGAGQFASLEGEQRVSGCSAPETARQRRLLVDIDLDQPHGRFEQRGGALELGRHHPARAAPRRPEIDQQRHAAFRQMTLEARRVERDRMPVEQRLVALAAAAADGFGLSSLARGTRLIVSQCGQTICSDGSICCSVLLGRLLSL